MEPGDREKVGAVKHYEPGSEIAAQQGRERSSSGYGVLVGLFMLISIALLILGLLSTQWEWAAEHHLVILAAAGVFAIIARITQASGQHIETIGELRRLQRK